MKMLRKSKFVLAVILMAQALTFITLFVVMYFKKRDLPRVFLALAGAGSIAGMMLLLSEQEDRRRDRRQLMMDACCDFDDDDDDLFGDDDDDDDCDCEEDNFGFPEGSDKVPGVDGE